MQVVQAGLQACRHEETGGVKIAVWIGNERGGKGDCHGVWAGKEMSALPAVDGGIGFGLGTVRTRSIIHLLLLLLQRERAALGITKGARDLPAGS